MSSTPSIPQDVQTPKALIDMIKEAALLHQLDEEAAEAIAGNGAMEIDGTIVVVTSLPQPEGDAEIDNDVAIVCPLPGVQFGSEAWRLMLGSNIPLVLALGCAFGCTDEGEAQLVHATRTEYLDAPRLAHKLSRMAAVAAALRKDLEQAADADVVEAVPG